jgi:hypothetical protein
MESSSGVFTCLPPFADVGVGGVVGVGEKVGVCPPTPRLVAFLFDGVRTGPFPAVFVDRGGMIVTK